MTAQRQEAPTFEQLAAAVDDAAAAAAALEGNPRRVAEAMRSAIEEIHREALVSIVRRLKQDEAGRAALFELVDDPLVHMLFSLHGIIRADPMTTAQTALDAIRPGLQSHGGDVELVRIEGSTAYVRLAGACNGCSMASVTMRTTVEQALMTAVPHVETVEVLPTEPSPAVIQLSPTRHREDPPEESLGWVRTAAYDELPDGKITEMRLTTASGAFTDVIVVRIGASLSAYEDACAHQGMPLGDAELDLQTGTLTCAWHGFCYDARSGECTSAPEAALEQLPLRVADGQVWVRVGA